jgi:hypothetical protein
MTDKLASLAHAAAFWLCIIGLGAFLVIWEASAHPPS